jgi:2-oxoglutarate ferredoxin oxidoreductase subunit gamma
MTRKEIRLSGFGGQGIILAGYILGKAAALYDSKHATLTQSYGPESRGGACAAELIIADEPIDYPVLIEPDVLVAMSQEAYTKYVDQVRPGGVVLIDGSLVEPGGHLPETPMLPIPATHIAEHELGKRMTANVVMLGFAVAATGIVSAAAARQAVLDSVPARFRDLNQTAFDRGYACGQEALAQARENHRAGNKKSPKSNRRRYAVE